MDLWDVMILAVMALYLLPALIYWFSAGDHFFGNLLFLSGCLLLNWTVIGWLIFMALAVDEIRGRRAAQSPARP